LLDAIDDLQAGRLGPVTIIRDDQVPVHNLIYSETYAPRALHPYRRMGVKSLASGA